MRHQPIIERLSRITIVVLGLVAILALSGVAPVCARGRDRQSFIKINDFYCVYSAPVVPYIDQHGVFMVGLEGMTRAWTFMDPNPSGGPPLPVRGTTSYDTLRRTAVFSFDHHTLSFQGSSPWMITDGHRARMAGEAIWEPRSRQMIVPVLALTGGLHLTTSWDAAKRVLSIIGDDLTHYLEYSDYGANVMTENAEPGRVVLERARLRSGRPPLHTPRFPAGQPWLSLTILNVTRHDIGANANWINATGISYGDYGPGMMDMRGTDPMRPDVTPLIRANGMRTIEIPLNIPSGPFQTMSVYCQPRASS